MEQLQREKNTMVLEWFDSLIFALSLVLLVFLFFFRTVTVDGASMLPTLESGEQLVARSFLYTPKKGDIVVIDGYIKYGAPLIKRVIAVGGDVVDINFEAGDVYVNQQKLAEEYILAPTNRASDVIFPITVPEGALFIMGDNRPNSKDSRSSEIGFIDQRNVLGEVVLRVLPVKRFGVL